MADAGNTFTEYKARMRSAYLAKHWPSLKQEEPKQPSDEPTAPRMRDGLIEPVWHGGNRRDYCDHWWHGQFWHVRGTPGGYTYWEYDAGSGFFATFAAIWLLLLGGLIALIALVVWATSGAREESYRLMERKRAAVCSIVGPEAKFRDGYRGHDLCVLPDGRAYDFETLSHRLESHPSKNGAKP